MSRKNKMYKVYLPCSELLYIANSSSETVYSPYLADLPIKINQEIFVIDFFGRYAILQLTDNIDGLWLYKVVNVHF